jgi:phage FluMu protein Com
MPIRFRCRYCNQLMGIARRKAGMTVQCPTCHAQLVVPQEEAEENPPAPAPAGPAPATTEGAAPVFERSDFEDFLQNQAAPEAPQPAAAAPPPPPLPFAIEEKAPTPPPLQPSGTVLRPRPAGLMLSPTQATWLTVAAILLLALAFGAGLLVGHYWMG